MSTDLTQGTDAAPGRSIRVDGARAGTGFTIPRFDVLAKPLLAVLTLLFVFVGVGNSNLGPADARIGLAAGARLGPLGQVAGYYSPELWPGRVAPSMVARFFEETGRPTPDSVLWPAAIAATIGGWLLAIRAMKAMGTRSGLWFGLAWVGSLGVIDHSGAIGLDFLSGLMVVAAIDRLIHHSSDRVAGLFTAGAFLAGGWPPVLVVFLTIIVLGRRESGFSPSLLIPPVLAAAGWSAWMLAVGSPEAWAAALALPFTQKPDWWLALKLLGLVLPFGPIGFLAFSPSLRQALPEPGRRMLVGWGQAAIACVIAGTIIPGLSQAARVPALAGMLLAAATVAEAAWARLLSVKMRRGLLAVTFGLTAIWLISISYGSYTWLLVFPYYRPVGLIAVGVGVAIVVLAWQAVERSDSRRAIVAMVLMAAALKVVHWGYYVPEWNYRHGQGPWGRAIGQWLLPNWTLYTLHDWPPDLLFATDRPVRKLETPMHLAYPETGEARHVLLLESEFENWPDTAPKLNKLAQLRGPKEEIRILAKTNGYLVSPLGYKYLSRE